MARLSWQDVSEIVVGRVLDGKLSAKALTVDMLAVPYDEMLHHMKSGMLDPTRLSEVCGLEPVRAVLNAAQAVEGLPLDWDLLLKRAAAIAEAGRVMERTSRHLLRGEMADVSPVLNAIVKMEDDQRRLVRLDEVEPDANLWVPVHYPAFDRHLGGIPKSYVTVVGAPPGVGKTSLLALIAIQMAKQDKTSVIFTLEMTSRHLLARMLDLAKMTKKVRQHIWVCDDIIPVEEVVAIASRKAVDGVDFIGVDFADLMIEGEESETKMAAVYKGLSALSKHLETPVMLLSQLNRRYTGGIPKMHHLRYSGMAEALCGLVTFIHNPSNVLTDEINEREARIFPVIKGYGYLVIAKSKCGYGDYGAPGAIQVKWDGKDGWGLNEGLWFDAGGLL